MSDKQNNDKNGRGMTGLVLLSIFTASANQILYKLTLNSFSSSNSNYGFFVSQFSTLMYTIQALLVSIYLVIRKPETFSQLVSVNQWIFVIMGLLDGASSTLGTIAGAFCPGELQTILNQSVIPVTMCLSYVFLGSHFKALQIWGSAFILIGALVASSDFIIGNRIEDQTVTIDISNNNATQSISIDSLDSFVHRQLNDNISTNVTSGAIIVFFVSVIFSGMSNVYKDLKMKSEDLDELHTSTVVSFWQLLIGFLFLPMLAIPSLGGLSSAQMGSQLADGWQCFLGHDVVSTDNCSGAAWIFIVYIAVNFIYNVLLLVITKRGSAVLLVVSQALSLPITNIAFTIPAIMGSADVEPLSVFDLAGLVLVAIGFLTYSGFGFAEKFIVAQGPPGQMAYAHVESQDVLLVPRHLLTKPDQLAKFLVDSALKDLRHDRLNSMRHKHEEIHDIEDQTESESIADSLLATQNTLALTQGVVSVLRNEVDRLNESIDRTILENSSRSIELTNVTNNKSYLPVNVRKSYVQTNGNHDHKYTSLGSSSGWSFYGSNE